MTPKAGWQEVSIGLPTWCLNERFQFASKFCLFARCACFVGTFSSWHYEKFQLELCGFSFFFRLRCRSIPKRRGGRLGSQQHCSLKQPWAYPCEPLAGRFPQKTTHKFCWHVFSGVVSCNKKWIFSDKNQVVLLMKFCLQFLELGYLKFNHSQWLSWRDAENDVYLWNASPKLRP